jgi:hypothetical protein
MTDNELWLDALKSSSSAVAAWLLFITFNAAIAAV